MKVPGLHIPGPMAEIELEWLYEQAKSMSSIIEIGSLRGRSTYALASGCKGPVQAVDIWDSNTVFANFIHNMKPLKNVTAHRMDSLKAATLLPDADMIFIDRTPHEYPDVSADLAAWSSKARVLICGHDYALQYPGVIAAVEEHFGKNAVKVRGSIWFKYKLPH